MKDDSSGVSKPSNSISIHYDSMAKKLLIVYFIPEQCKKPAKLMM
jgi:hypothetical protein